MSRTLRAPVPRDPALRATLQRRLLDAPFDPALLERPELRARLARMLREEAPLLATSTVDVVLDELVDDVGGLGPLEPLLDDASITEIMVNGPNRVFVEREGRIVAVACEIDAATIVRVVERVDRAAGPAAGSLVADGRRPPGRRLAAARGAPAARARRPVRLDPSLRCTRGSPVGVRDRARDGPVFRRAGAGRMEPRRVRCHQLGQDDVLQRARAGDRPRGADRHDRGDSRAAARPAPRRAARGAARQRRGHRCGERARPGAQRAAHATRPHHRRRGPRRRGARHAAGLQHRPRRLALDRACEQSRRRDWRGSRRSRLGSDVRAAAAGNPPAAVRGDRRDRAGAAWSRRPARHHRGQRARERSGCAHAQSAGSGRRSPGRGSAARSSGAAFRGRPRTDVGLVRRTDRRGRRHARLRSGARVAARADTRSTDRLRSGHGPAARARAVVARGRASSSALDAAAIDVPVPRALSTWAWSMAVAAVVGLGLRRTAVRTRTRGRRRGRACRSWC